MHTPSQHIPMVAGLDPATGKHEFFTPSGVVRFTCLHSDSVSSAHTAGLNGRVSLMSHHISSVHGLQSSHPLSACNPEQSLSGMVYPPNVVISKVSHPEPRKHEATTARQSRFIGAFPFVLGARTRTSSPGETDRSSNSARGHLARLAGNSSDRAAHHRSTRRGIHGTRRSCQGTIERMRNLLPCRRHSIASAPVPAPAGAPHRRYRSGKSGPTHRRIQPIPWSKQLPGSSRFPRFSSAARAAFGHKPEF